MYTYKVYLAGKSTGERRNTGAGPGREWREAFRARLEKAAERRGISLIVICPSECSKTGEGEHIQAGETRRAEEGHTVHILGGDMEFALEQVRASDFLAVNMEGLNTSADAVMEIAVCIENDIPVFAFGSRNSWRRLHPWLKRAIRHWERTDMGIINYMADYMVL